MKRRYSFTFILFLALWLAGAGLSCAESVTRAEVVAIARSYAELQWKALAGNVRQGEDESGVRVATPSLPIAGAGPVGYWIVNQTNTGMPYKWGGFDTIASFLDGVNSGRAAGDLYNAEKRRLGGAAVSHEAVGVDCSGFISRCWKLPKKCGTSTLPDLCTRLRSPAELKPGDIMNYEGGHVILFVEWLDETCDDARFYEAHPYSKVRSSDYSVRELAANGFVPLRYKRIRD